MDEARDKEIELAVVVIVEPNGAGGPAWRGHTGLLAHIRKRPISTVMIEDVSSVAGNVKILPAVAIVITRGHAHTEASPCHAGFLGDVGECSIVIIMIKRVLERFCRSKKIGRSAIDEVDIHPTIVVIIEEGASATDGFRQMTLR